MRNVGSDPDGYILAGVIACTDEIHRWPSRSSNASHSFGAAAIRVANGLEVKFFAEIYGRRTPELTYSGERWDAAMQEIVEAGDNRREAYEVLDVLTGVFHRRLDTIVTFDETQPPEAQVRIAQTADSTRIVSDSIKSTEAFIVGAQKGAFFTKSLLEATQRVPVEAYYDK